MKTNDPIFISYRRDDSLGSTGRLYDRLVEHFGADSVFIDVDGIAPGEDFIDAMEQAVGKCEILIAVIGKRWLSISNESGKRLIDNPSDFVRIEIAAALKRGITIVPVLVENAQMPNPDELPEDIRSISRRNAIEISHGRFELDTDRLIKSLESILKNPKKQSVKTNKKGSFLTSKPAMLIGLLVVFLVIFAVWPPTEGDIPLKSDGAAKDTSYLDPADSTTTGVVNSDAPDQALSAATNEAQPDNTASSAQEDNTQTEVENSKAEQYYHKLGWEAYERENYNEAIGHYTKGIEANPQTTELYYYRGLAYLSLKNYGKARSDFANSLKIFPNDADTYDAIGQTYYGEGNYNLAISNHSRAIKIKPEFGAAYLNRAKAYVEQNRIASACEDYSEAKKLKEVAADEFIKKYCEGQ
ncbi:MAG TPA: tetratricopeptide repeat protein [Flavitalea sp.]|nr:tetratricopeptide repeat protein [Flavitalea sp.]